MPPFEECYLYYPNRRHTSPALSAFIDYLLADEMVVPGGYRDAYTESLIRLPHSYQANDDSREILPGRSRSEEGLPAEGCVFGCFNNSYKIKPPEFDIWMALLREVEGSRLWLLKSTDRVEANLRAEAARRGVDPDRLVFAPKTAPADHLARQRHADIFLDTFNCNAHTTASDALWAGVPVVTKAGRGFAARVAASLLHALGLAELATSNERDYSELALSLAKNPDRLRKVRAKLAENRKTAPLFDSARFTRHLEQAYDLAFDRFVQGEDPADIIVPA